MTDHALTHRRSRLPGLIDPRALSAGIGSPWGWWQADSISASDNDLIDSWTDSSGNGRTATSDGGGARPTYKTNIVNGLPVLRFAGADWFDIGSTNLDQCSYFIVWSRANAANNDAVLLHDGGNYAYLQYGSLWYFAASTNVTLAMAAGTFMLKECVYNNSRVKGYTNGSSSFDVANSANAVFRYIGGSGFNLNGDVAELIIYDSAVSDTLRAAIEAYLNAKYGLW